MSSCYHKGHIGMLSRLNCSIYRITGVMIVLLLLLCTSNLIIVYVLIQLFCSFWVSNLAFKPEKYHPFQEYIFQLVQYLNIGIIDLGPSSTQITTTCGTSVNESQPREAKQTSVCSEEDMSTTGTK